MQKQSEKSSQSTDNSLTSLRTIFTWMYKEVRVCSGSPLLLLVIALKNAQVPRFSASKRLRPCIFSTNQNKTETNCDSLAHVFSRFLLATCISSSFNWFTVLSVFIVIGQGDYFGFGFTTLSRKSLNQFVKHNSWRGELYNWNRPLMSWLHRRTCHRLPHYRHL